MCAQMGTEAVHKKKRLNSGLTCENTESHTKSSVNYASVGGSLKHPVPSANDENLNPPRIQVMSPFVKYFKSEISNMRKHIKIKSKRSIRVWLL